MADITMCEGAGCSMKDECYRHTAKASDRQSYFVNPPFVNEVQVVSTHIYQDCEYFWDITDIK